MMTVLDETDVPRIGVRALERKGILTLAQLRHAVETGEINLRCMEGIGKKSENMLRGMLAESDEKDVKPATTVAVIGWVCPVCGAGLAPFVAMCPNHPNQQTQPGAEM